MKDFNDNDSVELDLLRKSYRANVTWPRPATAFRLGLYAASLNHEITDFGTHSARWQRLFNDGWTYVKQRLSIANP